jgi:hypothetical protein
MDRDFALLSSGRGWGQGAWFEFYLEVFMAGREGVIGRLVFVLILLVAVVGCDRKGEAEPGESAVPGQGSDNAARERLLERVNRNGDINDFSVPRPLVGLEEFFEGNDDYGSIGYNFYPDQPAPSEFYALFKGIRERAEVADVRVQVQDLEDPEGWLSTDTVWVITGASVGEVKGWLGERFRADDIIVGFSEDYPIESYDVPDGMQAIGVWWD